MLTREPTAAIRLREERGFTLVELLVAMISAVTVIAALVVVLGITLRQNTKLTDRVLADQMGRKGMNTMLEELRSSCTGFGSTAIQAPSSTPLAPLASLGASNLWFLSAYGNSTSGNAYVSPVTLHDVNWSVAGTSNTGKQYGTLTDYSFAGSGESPNWKFPSLSPANATTTKILATDVVPLTTSTLFRYERYETSSAAANAGELVEIGAGELPSVAANKKIAKVAISYEQAPQPAKGHVPDTREGHTTTFKAAVALRFTPTESTGEGWSCA